MAMAWNRTWSQAAKWFRKAAAQNYPLACDRLGMMHERGVGVPKDYVEAYKWFTLAAESGHIAAVVNQDNLKLRMTEQQIAQAENRARTNLNGTVAVSVQK
jgi:TPR repeat protein